MGTAAFAKFMKSSDGDSVCVYVCMHTDTYVYIQPLL